MDKKSTKCCGKSMGYTLSLIGAVIIFVGWLGISSTVTGATMLGIMLMLLGNTFMIREYACKCKT